MGSVVFPSITTEHEPSPAISVCVPVWKIHGRPNLASLAESLPMALAGMPGELVVVLNGVSREEAAPPANATVIELRENEGVPVAWNLAGRAARAPVLCFCNDDVLLGEGALATLHRALESHREAGVVGPIGTRWDVPRAEHLEYVSTEGLASGELRPCEVVSGFLFATRASTFEEAGGFDEGYSPCGFEEVDYCTNARLVLGMECYAVAGVSHAHEFGISAKRSWRRIAWRGGLESLGSISRRNRAHFMSKWSPLTDDL